jgi:hypothetical protein
MTLRWDPCVVQNSWEFGEFLTQFIDQSGRNCLLVGGAGFDPRTNLVPQRFSTLKHAKLTAVFFREERLRNQPLLWPRAEYNQAEIKKLLPHAAFPRIEIFADGVTTVGGRSAVDYFRNTNLTEFTDIFVDISALSCGLFYPLVAMFVAASDQCAAKPLNVHLLVVEEPDFDHRIRGIPGDTVAMLHGFKGERSLDLGTEEAVLWLPTLAFGAGQTLQRIYNFIHRSTIPIDVCPIVPFPGHDPQMPDKLVEQFQERLTSWRTDFRNIFYAAESDPLDAYRAISQLCLLRRQLFANLGGSRTILSPLGNKMLAVGAMLAAIDLQLPVAMVESVGYDEEMDMVTQCSSIALKHVWLCGEAYPSQLPNRLDAI